MAASAGAPVCQACSASASISKMLPTFLVFWRSSAEMVFTRFGGFHKMVEPAVGESGIYKENVVVS